jgi:hypothetical protein
MRPTNYDSPSSRLTEQEKKWLKGGSKDTSLIHYYKKYIKKPMMAETDAYTNGRRYS